MNEMIDILELKTYSKPHKVYIPSKSGFFVKRVDLEKLLETSHNNDYDKCCKSTAYFKKHLDPLVTKCPICGKTIA